MFLKTTAIFHSCIPTDCCFLWQTKRKNGMEEDEFSVCSAPHHTLPQLLDFHDFPRIFWRRALPSSGHQSLYSLIQCSVVLSRPQTSRTRKADCRCAGEPRTPRVAHMVGIDPPRSPGGPIPPMLRAPRAAKAAFGHSRSSCGSGGR